MGIFLTVFLACLLALVLILGVCAVLMVVAIYEYKKKETTQLQNAFDSFNINKGVDE